jgi:tRNA(fMet)-specific endonuclease VapC
MSYAVVLDACAYTAMTKNDKRVTDAIRKAELVVINPIMVGELSAGFLKGNRHKENFDYLDHFINDSGILWVDIDLDTADRYAIISDTLRKQGTPVPAHDIWQAALAWQHGYKILTLDEHFKKIPQAILAIDI